MIYVVGAICASQISTSTSIAENTGHMMTHAIPTESTIDVMAAVVYGTGHAVDIGAIVPGSGTSGCGIDEQVGQ